MLSKPQLCDSSAPRLGRGHTLPTSPSTNAQEGQEGSSAAPQPHTLAQATPGTTHGRQALLSHGAPHSGHSGRSPASRMFWSGT